jgi:hypothetical protein
MMRETDAKYEDKNEMIPQRWNALYKGIAIGPKIKSVAKG